jgi:hypothetical protein
MIRRVAALRTNLDGEYQLFVINIGGGLIKNCEYLFKFEAKFEKSLKPSKGLGRSSSRKKSEVKNLVRLSL